MSDDQRKPPVSMHGVTRTLAELTGIMPPAWDKFIRAIQALHGGPEKLSDVSAVMHALIYVDTILLSPTSRAHYELQVLGADVALRGVE